MKIMFIKREPLSLPDGISQFIFALSDALIRLGHDVICSTSDDKNLSTVSETYDFKHCPHLETLVAHNGSNHYESARLWMKAGKAFMAKQHPDLIILNGALPLRFLQPTILVAHDVQRRKFFGDIGRIFYKAITYRLVSQIVTTCPELMAPVAKECLCTQGRIKIIPTCIDTTGYNPQPLLKRTPTILHCGLHRYKNPDFTLRAFSAMRYRYAKLVIVGNPNVNPEIKAAINRMPAEIRERIELPGIVSANRLKELLVSSRVVSVPSDYIIPVASPTVLEAMAAHTPVVASHSISRIVVDDARNCFTEKTVEGMSKRFDELITQDSIWSKISEGCAQTKAKFDSVQIAKEYLDLGRTL
jgi:glycosyltransferase involved in cell wall biosynthesis